MLPLKEQAEILLKKFTDLGIEKELAKKCAMITTDEISKIAINAGYWIRVEDEVGKL